MIATRKWRIGWAQMDFQTRSEISTPLHASSPTSPSPLITIHAFSFIMVKQDEFTPEELGHLRKAVAQATEAYEAGDSPFGSVLVSRTGEVLQAHRNRIYTGSPDDPQHRPDASLHPEFTLAKWAQANMSAEERAGATVYTTGEHCPMCAALHAYVGLGPIVYVTSSQQFFKWMGDYGVDVGGVSSLQIGVVAKKVPTRGPVEGLDEEIKALHIKRWTKQGHTLQA